MKKLSIALVVNFLLILLSSCGGENDKTIVQNLKVNVSNYIVNGENANLTRFPWHVSIGLPLDGGHFCGGSIISSKFIITAAHCVAGRYESGTVLKAGGDGTFTNLKLLPEIKRIIVHPDFKAFMKNCGVQHNDIALLELKENIEFDDTTDMINLPESYLTGKELLFDEQSKLIVSGWGLTTNETQEYSKELKYVDNMSPLPLREDSFWETEENFEKHIPKSVWEYSIFVKYRPLETFKTGDYIALQTKDQRSTCLGDSGGPLVDENAKVLLGVNSHSSNTHDCKEAKVVYYTNVFKQLDWIRSQCYDCK